MELRMPQGHKSHCLAAESEQELQDWLSKLQHVLQITRQQEEKPVGTLERGTVARINHFKSSIVYFFFLFPNITVYIAVSSAPPSPHQLPLYGTLKGLEQSMNPQLMKYSRETDMSIALARKDNRRRLFSVYPHMPVSTLHGINIQ